MHELATIVLASVLSSVLGAGAIAAVFRHAAVNYLRSTFVEREYVFDSSGAKKFATAVDLNGIGRKVGEQQRELASLDDRHDALDKRISLVEERQTQQWERISEQMASTARTIEGVTQRLERVTEIQQQQALRLERLSSGQRT